MVLLLFDAKAVKMWVVDSSSRDIDVLDGCEESQSS